VRLTQNWGTICGAAMALRDFCSLRTKPTMSGCFAVPTEALHERRLPSTERPARSTLPERAAHCTVTVAPRQSVAIRMRLNSATSGDHPTGQGIRPFGARFDEVMTRRLEEADEFYRAVTPLATLPDAANVMRKALAGMLWTKQYYGFNGHRWLEEPRGLLRVLHFLSNGSCSPSRKKGPL
jgi:hypothetical protein